MAWRSSHLLLLLPNIYFPEREAIQLNISSPASAACPPFSVRSALLSLSELIACQFASNFLFFLFLSSVGLILSQRNESVPKKYHSLWQLDGKKILLTLENEDAVAMGTVNPSVTQRVPGWWDTKLVAFHDTHTWYACFYIKRGFFNCGKIYSTSGLLQRLLLISTEARVIFLFSQLPLAAVERPLSFCLLWWKPYLQTQCAFQFQMINKSL